MTSNTPSNPPSSRPMTLRQQLVACFYDELIMAVGNKFEGETRHQTALRYIEQAENQDDPPMQANLEEQGHE